jgi:hypothetical protein
MTVSPNPLNRLRLQSILALPLLDLTEMGGKDARQIFKKAKKTKNGKKKEAAHVNF